MKSGDVIEFLFFLIIMSTAIVGRIIKAQVEKTKSRTPGKQRPLPGNNNDWDDWSQLEPAPANYDQQPVIKPVVKMTGYNAENKESALRQVANTGIEPEIQTQPSPLFSESGSGWLSSGSMESELLWSTDEVNTLPQDLSINNDVNHDAVRQTQAAISKAFPATGHRMAQSSIRRERVIRLTIRGREDLRRAILLNEALGQPRAFDI